MKFDNYIKDNRDKKINIYFDIDGVIAEYDVGNFDYNTIRPMKSSIKRIEELIKQNNINVELLSICKNNKVVEEKYVWLKEYMPFFNLDKANLISKEEYPDISSQELKSKYLKEHTNSVDINILVDDDPSIIKHVTKNNDNIKVFHVSSIVD
jgi:5'(3')-deoxyribonucleotidase